MYALNQSPEQRSRVREFGCLYVTPRLVGQEESETSPACVAA